MEDTGDDFPPAAAHRGATAGEMDSRIPGLFGRKGTAPSPGEELASIHARKRWSGQSSGTLLTTSLLRSTVSFVGSCALHVSGSDLSAGGGM
jgi:hypothetical protein